MWGTVRSWLGGAPLGRAGVGVLGGRWGKRWKGNWGGGVEGGKGTWKGLGHGRRRRGGAGQGRGREVPQAQFCPDPILSPQMRTTQTEQGEKPNAHLLSSRRRHPGCRGTGLPRGDREVQESVKPGFWGAGGGSPDPRSWRTESLDMGCRRALAGSSLPRPGEGQRGAAAPASGWVGRLIRGSAPRRKAGVPTASTRSSGSRAQAGTAVELPGADFTRHHLQGLGRETGTE